MSKQKFEWIYCSVLLVTFLPVVFPVFELANHTTPLVLGLPFSFFWVLMWVIIAFITVICLYFVDPEKDNDEGAE
ncbi:DUF3311 domain-containing protein [Aquibacillus sediminis]|uniref:DUF3311 domain-containing protein n=1 Tax=Aquibacillus sediminis TaxID=2574734 RepID=UPI0011087885|nr:DUF3311 domain-containing protein [Aquibacillus sediminis]